MKINFPDTLQRCVVCHDWMVLRAGESPVTVCSYCGSGQTAPDSSGREAVESLIKNTGGDVSASDAALISLRLQQLRIRNGLASEHTTSTAAPTPVSKGQPDPYPAPDSDFTPTLKDYLNDHVLLGNVVLIAVDLGFAALRLLSTATFLGVLVAIVATGTVVDTWVHKFFH